MTSEFFYCGTVSSEGGPIVIMDGERTAHWPGLDPILSRHPDLLSPEWEPCSAQIIEDDGDWFLLWDIGGPGTADIFWHEDGLVLVRAWTDETDDDAELQLITAIANLPGEEKQSPGELDVASDVVCVLWSWEEGRDVTLLPQPDAAITWIPDSSRLSMDGTVRFARIPAGVYICHTDQIERQDWSACRCHLIRKR